MQRKILSFPFVAEQVTDLKYRMLNWAKQFGILVFLDSNNYEAAPKGYECLLACGNESNVFCSNEDFLFQLQALHDLKNDWFFGHICYDFKNKLEQKLQSTHLASIGFKEVHFFVPQTVCYINKAQTLLTIESFEEPLEIYISIMAQNGCINPILPNVMFTKSTNKESYLKTVEEIRKHIKAGDCYELNFCTQGYCENTEINPYDAFTLLNVISPAPFAAFYKLDDKYMMCTSPERYLCKIGSKIISQPIKGTAPRSPIKEADEEIKYNLCNSIKEQAENVMIVDLVRNDLARFCETGSIQVEDLFGIYSFPQVHQMISTISGKLKNESCFTDALRFTFPAGSMTGAPKHKVMQLIDHYEHQRRELFSGTIGYITPSGDFDFNVIIRSLFYNATTKYLSYQTGGAITYDSNAEQEWEEMRLKAWAMERIFQPK